MKVALGAICIFITGWVLGWSGSAGEISRECQKLGAFYVGPMVFECRVKDE